MWLALERQRAMASVWRTRRVKTDKGVGISLVAACRWCAACTLSSQYCRVPLLQLPWRSMHRITSDGSLDSDCFTGKLKSGNCFLSDSSSFGSASESLEFAYVCVFVDVASLSQALALPVAGANVGFFYSNAFFLFGCLMMPG